MYPFLRTASMFVLMAAITITVFSADVSGATFIVTTPADTQDAVPSDGFCADAGGACSLRAAITEANAFTGADIITLPAGTYTTTIAPTGENANLDGDFDITSDLTINGAGSGTTIVQANATQNTATERVFHLRSTTAVVVINDSTIENNGAGSSASFSGSGAPGSL